MRVDDGGRPHTTHTTAHGADIIFRPTQHQFWNQKVWGKASKHRGKDVLSCLSTSFDT